MLLQGLIDLDGKIQRPEYVGGQPELLAMAKENLSAWKVEPARVNGGTGRDGSPRTGAIQVGGVRSLAQLAGSLEWVLR